MVKFTSSLKEKTYEPQFEALLRELLGRVPSLKLSSLKTDTRLTSASTDRADLVVQVMVGPRKWTLVAETKRLGQPQFVRVAVLQLYKYLKSLPKDARSYGVILAPFLSAESAKICTEGGVGYADLAGNARLAFDSVFIETRGADNPFREKREKRSLFAPKAARVLRVLLQDPLRSWKVTDLAESARVSLGWVSAVRQQLLAREWGVADEAGLRLNKPEELARAWQKAYEPRHRSREAAYTLLHGETLDEAIRGALDEAGKGRHAVLASYSAARWIAPYARQATQSFYADKEGSEILRRRLQLQTVSSGENVVIWEPREDDVFVGRIEGAPGIWCTGLIQTWLDLSVAGERGGEAAEHLLQEKLLPVWKRGMT